MCDLRFSAVTTIIMVFLDVTTCSLAETELCSKTASSLLWEKNFRWKQKLPQKHSQIFKTTWCHTWEDGNLQITQSQQHPTITKHTDLYGCILPQVKHKMTEP